jgi:hypothetical protein
MTFCCHLLLLLRVLDAVLLTSLASQVGTTVNFSEKSTCLDCRQLSGRFGVAMVWKFCRLRISTQLSMLDATRGLIRTEICPLRRVGACRAGAISSIVSFARNRLTKGSWLRDHTFFNNRLNQRWRIGEHPRAMTASRRNAPPPASPVHRRRTT